MMKLEEMAHVAVQNLIWHQKYLYEGLSILICKLAKAGSMFFSSHFCTVSKINHTHAEKIFL
jgi:hypothetical protein